MAVPPIWRSAWAMLPTYHICILFLVLFVYSVRNTLVVSSTFYDSLDSSRLVGLLRICLALIQPLYAAYQVDDIALTHRTCGYM